MISKVGTRDGVKESQDHEGYLEDDDSLQHNAFIIRLSANLCLFSQELLINLK